jgi:hypothetical protein
MLKLHPDPGIVDKGACKGPSPSPGEQLLNIPDYAAPPKLYSEVMKVTIRTVIAAGLVKPGSVQEEIMHWQAGQLEYAVAALIIWSHTPTGEYVLAQLHLWRVPLSE